MKILEKALDGFCQYNISSVIKKYRKLFMKKFLFLIFVFIFSDRFCRLWQSWNNIIIFTK